MTLLEELDGDDFRNYIGMDYNCFDELLNLVSPLITKQNTLICEKLSMPKNELVCHTKIFLSGDQMERPPDLTRQD